MRPKHGILFLLAAAIALSSCATSRGAIDYRINPGANPASGKLVYIAQVTDSRVFFVKPPKPSMPSLKDDNITDPAITTRAIARKRNGYGMAMGDILLPEKRSVAMLVEEAVTKGLREKGYVVLPKTAPDLGSATPIKVNVKEFWSWMTPGFWTISLDFQALVAMSGEGLFASGSEEMVTGKYTGNYGGAGTKQWTATLKGGLDNFILTLKSKLK